MEVDHMLQVLGPAVALWEAPAWATSELVDYGSIEHRSCVGEVCPVEPEAALVVEVVQRDELDLNAEPITITRALAHVSVAGVWLGADQARDLARLLNAAADVIEDKHRAARR
jgi:hypothetical protein